MLKRTLTGVIAFFILIAIWIFADTLTLPIGVGVCALIAVYEILHCVGLHKNIALSIPVYLMAAATPTLMRIFTVTSVIKYMPWAIFALILYVFAICVFCHNKVDLTDAMTALVAICYAVGGMLSLIYLYDFHDGGRYFFLLAFLGACITDVFAYFTGVLFGKHKLIPKVSPHKTVEGSIGGVVFCVLAYLGFTYVYNAWLMPEGGRALAYWMMALVGVIASVIAQIGDLALSLFKRRYGIKDFGKVFPGQGGMLDRFDSIIPVAIVLAAALGFAL